MVKVNSRAPSWLMKICPVARPDDMLSHSGSYTFHGPAPRGWVEPQRVIYEHELVLFRDAHFVVDIEGQRIECPPNSFIIIPPGRWHVSWNADQRTGHRFWCHFDWEQQEGRDQCPSMTFYPASPIGAYYHRAPAYVPDRTAHGTFAWPQRVFDLADCLVARQGGASRHDRLVSRALLLELLLELLDEESHQPTDNSATYSLALQVRSILEGLGTERGQKPHIRQTLAKTGYSYEYLLRVFRRAFGLTPHQFIKALRLERAKLLLRETDQPIGKIAARVGIHDPTYFAEIFREHVGLLPSEFRQRSA